MSNGTSIVRHESTALATVDPRSAIAPRTPDDVWRMAQAVSKSGLYGVRSPEEALIRIATGMELGLSPMQSIRGVYVITANGTSRPTLSADMMVGVCKRSDLCEFFRMVESTDRVATFETKRKGDPGPQRLSYNIDQAKRAGLAGKGTWQAHTEAMLRARASSGLARIVYPDLLNGLYDEREFDEQEQAPAAEPPVVVESEPIVEALTLTEREVETLRAQMDEAATEQALKAIGAAFANAPMDDAQRKDLRAHYAKRKNKIAKVAREAAAALAPATEEHDAEPDFPEPGADG